MPNEPNERNILKTIGIGLMGIGEGITGQPYLSNYQNIQADAQRAKMQRDLENQKMEAGLIEKGNYPVNPSVMPPGGFDQSQMFTFNDKPYMKAPQQSYVPAYMMGPDGGLIPVISPNNPPGMVPKGSKIISDPNAPTADMRNAAVSADQAKLLWDDLRGQSEALKGGYEGIGELGKMMVNRGAGDSAKYKTYTDSLPSSAVGLYRALTGDTRLSDADAKARALPLLWNPSESTDVRSQKNAMIDRMIEARLNLLKSGKYQDGVVPLADIKKAAQSVNQSQSFNIDGKTYNIPADKVEAFKKAKGL